MDETFTLNDYIRLQNDEEELLTFPGSFSDHVESKEIPKPSQSVISNILNYSRSLSIRKSKLVDNIEMVLN